MNLEKTQTSFAVVVFSGSFCSFQGPSQLVQGIKAQGTRLKVPRLQLQVKVCPSQEPTTKIKQNSYVSGGCRFFRIPLCGAWRPMQAKLRQATSVNFEASERTRNSR
jgi:hypothetical protein